VQLYCFPQQVYVKMCEQFFGPCQSRYAGCPSARCSHLWAKSGGYHPRFATSLSAQLNVGDEKTNTLAVVFLWRLGEILGWQGRVLLQNRTEDYSRNGAAKPACRRQRLPDGSGQPNWGFLLPLFWCKVLLPRRSEDGAGRNSGFSSAVAEY